MSGAIEVIDETDEAEQLYQTVCHYYFNDGDCRVGFSNFDNQGKAVLYGMDDYRSNMFLRTIKYYPDEKRWKMVNECEEVVAWTDQEPIHPHLVPGLWYLRPEPVIVQNDVGHEKRQHIHDWHIQPDMMRQRPYKETFCRTYNFHAKQLIELVSRRFPGIDPLPPVKEEEEKK